MSQQAYIELFMGQTGQDFKHNILCQIHSKSAIAQRKFDHLRISMLALVGALVFGVLSQIIIALGV